MWPDSKGKGGKEGSPKSKDGGGETTKPNAGASGTSSGAKSGRKTKSKMKALGADGLPQQDAAQASAQLEQDILNAAQNMSQGQAKAEETKTLIEINAVPSSGMRTGSAETATSANLMRLPEASNENIDDKISSLWKSRVLGAYRANPRASQHILPAMPNNRGALEITDKARCDAQQAAMITAVDKMFDSFQNLAFEFNSVAQASDLELTWMRPTISRENISSWHQAAQVISVFTGRISTRRWTMVVRGTLESVLAYCIPADKLLAFTNQPANFQPVIELIPTADGLTVRWSVFGRDVSQEELGNIYRALLDNMIRIAQDDAPSDCFIDLAAYGVFIEGAGTGQPEQFNQPGQQVMGQDINYGAKYQQAFPKDDATSSELPAVPDHQTALHVANPFASPANPANPANSASASSPFSASGPMAQAQSYNGSGSSADWKPVVHSVRGANPPVPPTPMPGQSQGEQPGPSSLPTTPGFNQDEPWKYGSKPLPQGQPNQSISSFASRSGSTQSFGPGAGAGHQGQLPGDQNDEPPLPSLPAHLFEGLPPRPQNSPGAGFGQPSQAGPGAQASPARPSSYQGQPSPWAPAPGASNSGVSSTSGPPSTSSSDGWKSAGSASDGWKSAGIPATKAMQSLPPLPVPSYQSPTGSPFAGEPAPPSSSLSSSGSFTSGSIRVDAIAREIAHSQVSLPPAIPGFEPYSIGEAKPELPKLRPEAPQAPLGRMELEVDDQDPDTFPETSYELDSKPWPKPRAQAIVEPEAEVEPAIVPQAKVDSTSIVGGPAKSGEGAEQNAFINFEIKLPLPGAAVESPEQDDPEIAALFEGEPVNAPEVREEPVRSVRSSSPKPAYMDWLEPAPPLEEATELKQAQAEAKSRSPEETTDSPVIDAVQDLSPWKDEEIIATPVPAPVESALEESQEQYSQPPSVPLPEQASAQFAEEAAAQEVEKERPTTGERSRAAIEEGFRQAQAAFAASKLEHLPPKEEVEAESAPPVVPGVPAQVPFAPAPIPFASAPMPSAASFTSSPSSIDPGAPAGPGSPFIAGGPGGVASPVGQIDTGRSLKVDIDRLLANLDSELEVISAKGSEAFAKRDLRGAERMIKLAETLGEFKESLTKLKEQHGQDLS